MISTQLLCPKREFCQVSSNVVDSDFTAFGGIFGFCVVACGGDKFWKNGVKGNYKNRFVTLVVKEI